MKFLVDTNVISELRKRERATRSVQAWVRATKPRDIATSVVVLAEIRHGIELKRRRDQDQAEAMDIWLRNVREGLGDRVLAVTEPIADAWARLGIPDPLPFIDGLLAATAKVHDLTVVTRNVRDIERCGVPVLNPFEA